MEVPPGIVHGVVHAIGIALVIHMIRGAPSGEDVEDLAHSQTVQPSLFHGVHHGFLGRLQGEVVPVGGPLEGLGAVAYVGTGNDPAHAMVTLENGSRLPAALIQLLQRDPLFVCRHLEDGVGGSVNDPLTRFLLLHAVVVDHRSAGVGLVAQNPPARSLLKFLQNLLREALGIGGHGLGRNHTGNLPVADGGVLAHRCLRQLANGPIGVRLLGKEIHPIDVAKPSLQQIGHGKLFRACAGAQGVDAIVPKLGGIRQLTNTTGIQNDQKYTLHITFSPWRRPHPGQPSSWW